MSDVKVTKAQQEFFAEFSKDSVKQILGPILEFRGLEGVNDEMLEAVVAQVDLKDLTLAIARGFLERVEFTTLKRVDKFMRGEEFAAVAEASREVNALVQSALIEVIAPLIPLTPEEQAEKDKREETKAE